MNYDFMENKELWVSLFDKTKEQLREELLQYGITRTKTLTKYDLIVKLYNIKKDVSHETL